jgi:predicted CXXCH cytochrome family protein
MRTGKRLGTSAAARGAWLCLAAACFAWGQESAPAAAEGSDCLKCHSPIQAVLQKKVKHAALDMGCSSCHIDHRQPAAGAERLLHYLNAKQPGVCLTCHDAADQKLAASHRGQPFEKSQCTGCHDPHSSDVAKLIPAEQHGPYGARQCEGCHQPAKDGKIVLAAASANELCFGCHDDMKKRLDGAKSKHTLLADGNSCVDCHDPHASNRPHFLKQSQAALCNGCHADVAGGKKYVHEPVRTSCVFCHDAHGSDFPASVQAGTQELCLGCHGPNAVKILAGQEPVALFGGRVTLPPRPFETLRYLDLASDGKTGHPMLGHPAFAPAAKGKPEMNCLTCHLAHGAEADRRLLVTDKGALCLKCHDK